MPHASLNIINSVLTLNHDPSMFAKWCSFNKLAFNSLKTKAILFTPKVVDVALLVFINDFPIEIIGNYIYLEIKIDKQHKFSTHISHVKARLSHVVGASFVLRKLIDISTARAFYFCMAYSVYLYMIPVWGGASGTLIQSVQVSQNKIVRNLFGHRFPELHTAELLKKINLLNISKIYKLELGKLMLFTMPSSKYNLINTIL